MRLKFFLYYLFVFILILNKAEVLGKNIYEKTEESIKALYGENAYFTEKKITIDNNLNKIIKNKFYTRNNYNKTRYWVISKQDSVMGLAFIEQAFGKKMYFTYLIIVSIKGKIEKIEILKYPEIHGRGVTKNNWLNMFKGAKLNENNKLDVDIHSLSGATISTNALINDVRRILFIFQIIKKQAIK